MSYAILIAAAVVFLTLLVYLIAELRAETLAVEMMREEIARLEAALEPYARHWE